MITISYPTRAACHLVSPYQETVTCILPSGKRVSAYYGWFLSDGDRENNVASYLVDTIDPAGWIAPPDDLVTQIENEKAIEHYKFDGDLSFTPLYDDAAFRQYYTTYNGQVELVARNYSKTVECQIIRQKSGTKYYFALLPYFEDTWKSPEGRTLRGSWGAVPVGRHRKPSYSGCVFYHLSNSFRGFFVATWNRSDNLYFRSTTFDPTTIISKATPDETQLPWAGTYQRYDTFTNPEIVADIWPEHGLTVPQYVLKIFDALSGDMYSWFKPDHPDLDVWGELANRCTGAAKATSSNVLSTTKEIFQAQEALLDLLKGVNELRRTTVPKHFLKAVGNLRLAWKWGLPLTAKDAAAISEGFQDYHIEKILYTNPDRLHYQHSSIRVPMLPVQASRPSNTSCTRQCWLKILYRDNNTAKKQHGAKLAADLNLLTLENGWDIVPYSFVVDWLTDFASFLNAGDNVMYRTAFWDIVGSVRSTKDVCSGDYQALARYDRRIAGSWSITHYIRRVYETIPLPTLGYLNPSFGVTQWLDGATLISQLCD